MSLCLIEAISENYSIELIDNILLDKTLDINAKNENGQTALHIACQLNRPDLVEKIINRGADKEVIDEFGQTPMHIAAGLKGGQESVNMANLLLPASIDAIDCMGRTPLHIATKLGHLEMVKWLLLKKANIEHRCFSGNTALHWAASRGHCQIAFHLIGKGAQVNVRNVVGSTPLHLAAAKGLKSIVSLLISCRVDEQILDSQGCVAAQYAIRNKYPEIVSLLAEYSIRKTESLFKKHKKKEENAANKKSNMNKPNLNKEDVVSPNSIHLLFESAKRLHITPLRSCYYLKYENKTNIIVHKENTISNPNNPAQMPLTPKTKAFLEAIAKSKKSPLTPPLKKGGI